MLFFMGPEDNELLLTPESLDFSLRPPPLVRVSSGNNPDPKSPFLPTREGKAVLVLKGLSFILLALSTRFIISLEHLLTTSSRLLESSVDANVCVGVCEVGTGEPS